ncbi:hypothetical protein NKJ90_03055 [Mesorhizobium sp. M0051]|uniref:hypothetical protein n=1 Tax=unclassified Mesorhizobium TaxID=325217 RepID=UPI0004CFD39C|nr:hypothetical protein [Mesorhizobium sp. LNHC252B00]
MLAFKVFQDGEGERKVLLAGRHLGGDGETYSMKPDEFDRFLEAALAVKAALHDGEHSQP